MKILTKLDEEYLMDTFGIIKVAMMDFANDPVQTTGFINHLINDAVVKIGGQKGADRCAKKVSLLLESFAKKGIMEGLSCDEKT